MKEKKLQFEDATDFYLGSPNDEPAANNEGNNTLTQFYNKPFYIWTPEHQAIKGIHDCCFSHMVGLPLKNDEEHPWYDYEKEIYDALESGQHTWIKKSRGIGVTTFLLYYLTWRIVSTHELDNKHVFIISGTKEEFSNQLKVRMEKIFERVYPLLRLQSKYTELWINKTWIKVFPSKNIKGLRGYIDVSYIFVDEADFFETIEQNELESVIKSYEEKSKGQIIMVSTPNRPDGLFYKIEHENKFGKEYFNKILLDYRRGLGKIYDSDFIEKERDQPYFGREYDLQYFGKVGNVFPHSLIEAVLKLGDEPWPSRPNQYSFHPVGVDFGFNVSKTVICVGEWDNELKRLRIVKLEDFGTEPPTPEEVANVMFDIYREYGTNTHFFIDGSNRGSVNQIKKKFGESMHWEKEKDFNKRDRIHPVAFGVHQEHKNLLFGMFDLCTKGMLAIPRAYDKLVLSMRTATMIDWDLNKNETVNNDYLDAARLMTKGIQQK